MPVSGRLSFFASYIIQCDQLTHDPGYYNELD